MSHEDDLQRPDDATKSPDRDGSARAFIRDALGALAAGQESDSSVPTPDLLALFDEQLTFITDQYPNATPTPVGQDHLDELAGLRAKHLKRTLALDTADRVAAIVARVLRSAAPVSAIALVGRHVGAW